MLRAHEIEWPDGAGARCAERRLKIALFSLLESRASMASEHEDPRIAEMQSRVGRVLNDLLAGKSVCWITLGRLLACVARTTGLGERLVHNRRDWELAGIARREAATAMKAAERRARVRRAYLR